MKEQMVTVREAASRLGLSRHTLYAWIAQRRIGHTRLGRAVRIPEVELQRIVDAGTVDANSELEP